MIKNDVLKYHDLAKDDIRSISERIVTLKWYIKMVKYEWQHKKLKNENENIKNNNRKKKA